MIRVTVEHVTYVTVEHPRDGDYEIIGNPSETHPLYGDVRELKKVLLLQECDNVPGAVSMFNLKPLVCLLNDITDGSEMAAELREVVSLNRITPEIVAALREVGIVPSEE